MKEMEKEINRRDRDIDSLRRTQEELAGLLEETKNALEVEETASLQREDEKRKLERNLEEQKRSIAVLEEELLAFKYESQISYANITQDNSRLQEL